MKALLLISLVVLAPSLAWVQPSITEANLPEIGDHVIIGINWGAITPGPAGSSVIWDHGSLVEENSEYFDYVEPSSTDWWEDFTASTLCGISWTESHSYYSVSRGSLHAEGYAVPFGEGEVAKTLYDDIEQILTLPYTYGSSFQDAFSGTWWFGSTPFPFTGTVDFEADGYGTLILPTGTYENVVRYHIHREQNNGTEPNSTIQTKDQWAWVSSDYRFWLLLMESNFDGFSYSYLTWWDKNPYAATPVVESSWGQVKALF